MNNEHYLLYDLKNIHVHICEKSYCDQKFFIFGFKNVYISYFLNVPVDSIHGKKKYEIEIMFYRL